MIIEKNVTKDHPRVCGEKEINRNIKYRPTGSPPRMRGKVPEWRYGFSTARITPAYAGKSRQGQESELKPWDHPRVCGEKNMSVHTISSNIGSPPRMRGKDTKICDNSARVRITPAYAGKS